MSTPEGFAPHIRIDACDPFTFQAAEPTGIGLTTPTVGVSLVAVRPGHNYSIEQRSYTLEESIVGDKRTVPPHSGIIIKIGGFHITSPLFKQTIEPDKPGLSIAIPKEADYRRATTEALFRFANGEANPNRNITVVGAEIEVLDRMFTELHDRQTELLAARVKVRDSYRSKHNQATPNILI